MDDSKLLEIAGKAAGETYDLVNRNPLERDDLALRLAVKLDLEVYQGLNDSPCAFAGFLLADAPPIYFNEPHGDDKYAATRRAIVRAAAALEEPHHEG